MNTDLKDKLDFLVCSQIEFIGIREICLALACNPDVPESVQVNASEAYYDNEQSIADNDAEFRRLCV